MTDRATDYLDREEIRDLSRRYMRGLDRLDLELLASVFADDATVDYGFFLGTAPDFLDFAHGALKDHLANHHLIGQMLVVVEGDRAVGEIYFQAFHRIVEDGEEKDLFISILATFGISILMQQLMNQVFSADVQTVDSGLGTWFLFDGNVTVLQIKVVSFATALVLGVCLAVFMKKTRLGQAIRATAQNARAARILGIDTDRVYCMTFALNAAICGACGALVLMTWVIQPFMGLAYTIRSFMIVIVAGIGNVAGVVLAGLGLGVAENFAGFILGAEFQAAFVFSLLVVILVWRNFTLRLKRKYLE